MNNSMKKTASKDKFFGKLFRRMFLFGNGKKEKR